MKRTILHLIPGLWPGGAERQIAYLCEGLVKLGWDVHVGHITCGPYFERLAASGATTHRLPAGSNYDPRLLWHTFRLIRRVSPVAVQTWIPMMDLIGGAAARLAGVPWILSERSNSYFELHRRKIRLRGKLGRLAAAVVSNSPAASAYWNERLAPPSRSLAIPNALPIAEIAAAPAADRSDMGLQSSGPLVLFLSRLDPIKNFEVLFDALERVVDRSAAQVLICGQGEMQGYVEHRIASPKLAGRVIAAGFVPNPWSWFKAADVFVSVSRYEGMPNAVMEAMAAGCPVVLSNIPSHTDMVGPEEALFASVDDPEAVANAILDCLRSPETPKRVAAARRRAESWSIEAVARRWESLYLEVGAPSDDGPGRLPREVPVQR